MIEGRPHPGGTRRWAIFALVFGVVVLIVGVTLVVGNSQEHRECQSLFVDAFAHGACGATDRRYTAGIIGSIIGGVMALIGLIGVSTKPKS